MKSSPKALPYLQDEYPLGTSPGTVLDTNLFTREHVSSTSRPSPGRVGSLHGTPPAPPS